MKSSHGKWKYVPGVMIGVVAPWLGTACGDGEAGPIDKEIGNTIQAQMGQNVCILGSDELQIGSRATAHGPAAAGFLNMQPDANADSGSIRIDGNGFAGDRADILGDITLAGTLTQGSGVTITGTLLENTPVTLPTLPTQAVSAGTQNVFVPPGTNLTLDEGDYGHVSVGAGAVVALDGTYDVLSLTLAPDAVLAESPPGSSVRINSVGDINLGDRAGFAAAYPSVGLFDVYSNGSVSIGNDAFADAIISAPNGTVIVRSRAIVDGCVGAQVLQLEADAEIETTNPSAQLPVEPSGDSDGDGLPDQVETNTGVFIDENDTGTDPMDADTDDDGINDGDEVLGTEDGLDLPSLGVNPLRKNILLEYDWFDDSNDCAAHSHRPTPAAIDRATQAFANAPVPNPDGSTGITLINDYGQGGAFTGGNFIDDADGVLVGGFATEYQNYKAANFATNRQGYFHYVLMPHRYNTTSSSSGLAEIVGDDMIVSLYCANSDVNVANTIVHELGHNLGLLHGGFEGLNYKPNYNSVMNYRFQFPGIDTSCDSLGDGVLDYSVGEYITLDESALDESAGVCGDVPIDWNQNSVIDTQLITADINNADGQFSVLEDYNDWDNLVYDFAPGFGTLVAPQVIECDNPAPMNP